MEFEIAVLCVPCCAFQSLCILAAVCSNGSVFWSLWYALLDMIVCLQFLVLFAHKASSKSLPKIHVKHFPKIPIFTQTLSPLKRRKISWKWKMNDTSPIPKQLFASATQILQKLPTFSEISLTLWVKSKIYQPQKCKLVALTNPEDWDLTTIFTKEVLSLILEAPMWFVLFSGGRSKWAHLNNWPTSSKLWLRDTGIFLSTTKILHLDFSFLFNLC